MNLKWREVFLSYSIGVNHYPQFLVMLHMRSTIMMTAVATNSGFPDMATSAVPVLILSQEVLKQFALSLMTGDNPYKLVMQVKKKLMWLPANEAS